MLHCLSQSLMMEVKLQSRSSWDLHVQNEAKVQIPIQVILISVPLKRCWNQTFCWSQLLAEAIKLHFPRCVTAQGFIYL